MCLKEFKTENKICPKCNNYILGYPALSREDNKTEICSKCGTLEGLEKFIQYNNFEEIKNKINIDIPKLIALCGSACTGKTTTSIKLAEYISYNKNVPVVFFSLETEKEIIKSKIKNFNSNLFIIDTPRISIVDICKTIKELKRDKGIKFVIIDYLQLISYDKSKCLSRDIEIENICKELKKLVEELNIPILVTSHISRNCNSIIDKKDRLQVIDEKIFLRQNIKS